MATANRTGQAIRSNWLRAALVVMLAGGGVAWFYGDAIGGYTEAGTAYGAKNACSCRYLAGRDIGSCETDFLPGMGAVFLSEDEEQKTVTAWVPLVAANTARFREGFGCVLEPWER